MDNDMKQLADILVDWCESDLCGDDFIGVDPSTVAQSFVKSLAFTLANDSNAREVLERIIRNEMEELRARFRNET